MGVKILFGGFSLFFIGLSFLLFKLGFREVNIQKDLWTEVKVTFQSSKLKSRMEVTGRGVPMKRHSLHLQMEEAKGFLSDLYLDYFDMKAFKKEVRPGDVLYMTVRKDKTSIGGLRKENNIYFSLDKMKQAEGKSLFVLQVLFWFVLSITLFWLRITWGIFNPKVKSLSERLTSKD